MRGDVYVWGDGDWWHIWADRPEDPTITGWAANREHPNGVRLSNAEMARLCNRFFEMYPFERVKPR